MAKQLNVSLNFQADTSQAKKQLQDLQNTLTKLVQEASSNSSQLGLNKEISEAITSANQLKIALENATDIKTGVLNLGKLNEQLKGQDLSKYGQQLASLGPTGQKAFSQMAQAISTASIPLRQSSALLTEFKNTLFNTIRWQASSSMIHAVMGAIQGAYQYSQELNESLNNIRIVTGYSADEMAKFADRANTAASSLSASTTAYTDAALIYYQQGIRDQDEIEARTNTTVKLANVSRQSAEDVSSQMTAIWNNFDDGSKSLEYYADVITALGASTASSSEEIATGMEKFAAVADTVGLSYEYAAASVATVVAETRQSADTVGTAFRTIFSRLEGLKLGETLEDGVDLNKYSQALKTIGVDILDATGNVKDMDTILDETAAHWDNLTQAQKVAFAETVGGVRQYTNLIALLDNWDEMQENVLTAKNSTGTLQEQQEIYAQGWEAAKQRVTTALEDIYAKIMDDDAFIALFNGIEKVIHGVDWLIDSLGGFKSVIPLIINVLSVLYQSKLTDFFDNLAFNFKLRTGQMADELFAFRDKANQALMEMLPNNESVGAAATRDSYVNQGEAQQTLVDKQQQMLQNGQQMDETTQRLLALELQVVDVKNEQLRISAETVQTAEGELHSLEEDLSLRADINEKIKEREMLSQIGNKKNKSTQKLTEEFVKVQKSTDAYKEQIQILEKNSKKMGSLVALTKKLKTAQSNLKAGKAFDTKPLDDYLEKLKEINPELADINFDDLDLSTSEGLQTAMERVRDAMVDAGVECSDARQKALELGAAFGLTEEDLNEFQSSAQNTGRSFGELADRSVDAAAQLEYFKKQVAAATANAPTMAEGLAQMVSGITAYTMAVNSMTSLGEIWTDKDASIIEKITKTVMALGFAIRGVKSITEAMNTIQAAYEATQLKKIMLDMNETQMTAFKTAIEGKELSIKQKLAIANGIVAGSTSAVIAGKTAETAAVEANTLAWFSNPITAIIAIALLAVVAVIGAVSSAMKANSEAVKENAKAEQEKLEKTQESLNKNKELIDSYSVLKKKYDENKIASKELEQAALDVAEAYAIQNAALLVAQGNYDELTRRINEARAAELEEAKTQASLAVSSAEASFRQNMRDGKGYVSGDNYYADFGGIFNGTSDEGLVLDALKNVDTTTLSSGTSGTLSLNTTDSTEGLIAAYEDVQAVIVETRRLAAEQGRESELNQSEYYTQMVDWLNKSQEAYEALTSVQQAYNDINAESAIVNTLNSSEFSGSITSQEEYNRAVQQSVDALVAQGMAVEDAEKAVRSYMSLNENYADFERINSLLEQASNSSGVAQESLQNFYANLSDDEKEVFFSINFDRVKSEADLRDQMDLLQARADTYSIRATLETINTAQEGLSDNMSAADYQNYQSSSGINWGEDGFIKYSEFLAMTYEEQTNYLQQLENDYNTNLSNSIEETIAADTSRIAQAESDLEGYRTAKNNFITWMDDEAQAHFLDDIVDLNRLEEGTDEYNDKIAEIASSYGLAEEAVQGYIQTCKDIDAAETEIQNLNYEINSLSDEVQIRLLLDTREFQDQINEISSKEFKIGDILSIDEFNILEDLGVENLDNYLQTMADGTYKLVGSAEDFNAAIDRAAMNNAVQSNNSINNAIRNSSWGSIDTSYYDTDTGNYVQQTNGDSAYQRNYLLTHQSDTASTTFHQSQADVVAAAGLDTSQFLDENGQIIETTEALQALYAQLDLLNVQYQANSAYIAENATSVRELQGYLAEGLISHEQYEEALQGVAFNAMQNAESLDELNQAYAEANAAGAGITDYQYGQALLELAEKFDNTADECEDYAQALLTGDEAQIAAARSALELAVQTGELAKKYNLDATATENYSRRLAKQLEQEGMSKEAAAKMGLQLAVANQRLDRGLTNLNKNISDYRTKLKDANKGSAEWSETMDELKDNLADVLNVDISTLTDEFGEAVLNSEDLENALDGDIEAIQRLQTQAAEAMMLEIQSNLPENSEELNTFTSQWDYLREHMQEAIESPEVDQTQLIESFNSMIEAGNMTKEQIETALAGLHVSANVVTTYVPQKVTVPQTITEEAMLPAGTATVQVPGPDGTWVDQEVRLRKKVTRTYDAGTVEVDGVVPQYSIEGTTGDGGIQTAFAAAPAVTPSFSSTKSGGAGGSSGGGGGGSSSKKETKEHKDLTDEKERYHVINQEIERQSNLLDRLSKNKDRAFGPQKQKYYEKELSSLKKMGDLYREHLKESTAYLAQDKLAIQAYGAVIGDDNTILNYDDLIAKQVAAYNAAVDKYNVSGQSDADKEALQAAEDAYQKFLDDLKQYEDTVAQHEEDINNYVDNMIEQYDTMQAKTAEAIEFRLEYDDSVLDFLDKLIERLDTWNGEMFAATGIMEKLNEQTGALKSKNKDLETGVHETLEHFLMDYDEYDDKGNVVWSSHMSYADSDDFIKKLMNGEVDDKMIETLSHMPQEEYEALQDLIDQLQDNTDAIIANTQAVVDNIGRQFEDAAEELAEAAKPIASATAALDNYASIIEIVGADYLGVTDEILTAFQDQQWNVLHETTMANKATMESLAAQRDMIQIEMDKALAAGNTEMAEMYREQLKSINDEVQSATEEWYSSWQAELSKMEEDFEAHIDRIKEKALDLAAGDAGTWQSLKDTMDYAAEAADRFLPEYKEIYEFSKLNRDINKSIDDTDNIKNKQALKKLQNELNQLQEKSGEISQYDLDNARRRYELELARLALEESRNAKSTVRLSKDSEGNWSYIYTANEEDVANAEQNYEDKLYAMQSANAEYIDQLQSQLTQATEDYYNKVAEINLIYKDDEEKRQEEITKARERYQETIDYYGGELEKAMDNNQRLYDEDWSWYSDYTKKLGESEGYRLGDLNNYVTNFNQTMLGMATGYDNLAGYEDAMIQHAEEAEQKMDEAYQSLKDKIEYSMQEAGTSVENFADDMMDNVDNTIVPKAEEARDAVEQLGEEAVNVMDQLVDQADAWRTKYESDMQAIIEKNGLVVKSIQEVTGALSTLKENEIGHDESKTNDQGNTSGSGKNGSESDAGSSGTGTNAAKREELLDYRFSGNGIGRKYYAAGKLVGERTGSNSWSSKEAEVIQKLINAGVWGKNYSPGWWTVYSPDSADNVFKRYGLKTGGYTGDWSGEEGKLALLHQKELVLNEDDTKNMLKSVEIIRSLASMIDLNAKASEFAIGNLSAAGVNTTSSEIEQSVTITAEFPNATDRNEIAEAFNTLINQASQYANRKY